VQPVYSLGWTLNYEMMFYCLFALALPLKRSIAVALVVCVLMAMVMVGQLIPSSMTMLQFWTRSIIIEFGLGMIIGHMALSGVRPDRTTGIVLIVMGICLLVFGKVFPLFVPDRALLFGLPAALFVMAALAFDKSQDNAPAIKMFASLGDASYAIYLLHPFVLRGLGMTLNTLAITLHPLIFLITGVTLTCMLAVFVWRWFERPVTQALQGPKRI
jgi:exopolysaccharide production protein ExoZ